LPHERTLSIDASWRPFVKGGRETSVDEPRDWDGATYDRIADPMFRWGRVVVGWLDLAGGERVLDAGCGSGRVTELLLERLLHGRVVALDGSPSMIEQARRRLERFGDRVELVLADLARPLPVEGAVDAILSTATFHWVPDHDALFRNLAAVLRPGGQLAAQCGGAGNLASVAAALAELGHDPFARKVFATPEATRARLLAAGFVDVECWLHEEPTQLEAGEPLETYLATVVVGAVLDGVPEPERAPLVREVARRLPRPELDYVRLNIRAHRG
jgi:trans-aconitate 2-methyltransferase